MLKIIETFPVATLISHQEIHEYEGKYTHKWIRKEYANGRVLWRAIGKHELHDENSLLERKYQGFINKPI